ncbi:MAG: hypothetical protein KA498_02140 [Neisseriaceae bacterium]|nr:hypothetical protein [Neisseriaceae bacterium]
MSNKLWLSRFLKEGTAAATIKSLWPSEPDECLYVSLSVGAPEFFGFPVYVGNERALINEAMQHSWAH